MFSAREPVVLFNPDEHLTSSCLVSSYPVYAPSASTTDTASVQSLVAGKVSENTDDFFGLHTDSVGSLISVFFSHD